MITNIFQVNLVKALKIKSYKGAFIDVSLISNNFMINWFSSSVVIQGWFPFNAVWFLTTLWKIGLHLLYYTEWFHSIQCNCKQLNDDFATMCFPYNEIAKFWCQSTAYDGYV
jgi:hypothetical protein